MHLDSYRAVEGPAQIAQGTLRPVVLVDDLHFELDDYLSVKGDFDVEKEVFGGDALAQFDGIHDLNRDNIVIAKMKQRADESP